MGLEGGIGMAGDSARVRTQGSKPAPADDHWAELRDLLVGPERAALELVTKRLDDLGRRAEDTSAVLPQALLARAGDEELRSALLPSVEEAIRISVERDPRVLVDAVFPIIGPAIRKALSTTLSSMIESLNETLDRTFSLEGLRWRLESLRTGRSFGEVVLLRTLEYSVEEVFLVHAETGLLLQHVVDPTAQGQDAQTVSGMLSAIREFVSDSFRTEAGGSLEGVKVGDLTVVVEAGPLAFLVGVVRGTVPGDLRPIFQRTIEDIHRDYSHWLERYAGDNSLFEVLGPNLEACLQKRYRPRKKAGRKLAYVAATAAAILILIAAQAARTHQRWSNYVDTLEAEGGFIVLDEGRSWGGSYHITGLRDPLAADPDGMLGGRGFEPEDVASTWHLYYSDAPDLVLARVQRLLDPPVGVELAFEAGTLRLAGEAPPAWVEQAARLAVLVPGVTESDHSQLNSGGGAAMGELAAAIEGAGVRFDLGSAEVRAEHRQTLADVAAMIETLASQARAEGTELQLHVIGHTDASGDPEANVQIGQARARSVATALGGLGVDSALVRFRGAGYYAEPAAGAQSPYDPSHRRATFQVHLQRPAVASTADR